MSNYVMAFDTETGGLNCKEADVLTAYFAILDEDLNIIDELDLKLKPDDRLPIAHADALKVNKIDLHKHFSDPETITYSEGKKKLVALLKKYHQKKGRYNNIRPLGQNVQFDIDFVQEYLLPVNEWNALLHYSKIDTKDRTDFLKDAQWFPKDLGSLESVVTYLGLPKRAAHNAKDDTLMMIDVHKTLISILKSKKDNGTQQDLISLLEAE